MNVIQLIIFECFNGGGRGITISGRDGLVFCLSGALDSGALAYAHIDQLYGRSDGIRSTGASA